MNKLNSNKLNKLKNESFLQNYCLKFVQFLKTKKNKIMYFRSKFSL